MEIKKYVYYGKELPKDCTLKKNIELQGTKNDVAFPHLYGLEIGEDSKEHGRRSYIVSDGETTKMLDALIAAGCTRSMRREVMRKREDGDYENLVLTQFFLMYKAEDTTFDLPTASENISNACNVETNAVLEVKLLTDDGDVERYINFPFYTSGPFSTSLLDFLEGIEDEFDCMFEEGKSGFSLVKEDGFTYYEVMFFDVVTGQERRVQFDTMSELLRTVCSVRLVKVENKIVERTK